MASGKDQAVLMAAKDRLASLTLECSSIMSWLANLTLSRLRSLTLRCRTNQSLIAALPVAPALHELRVTSPVLMQGQAMFRQFLYLTHIKILNLVKNIQFCERFIDFRDQLAVFGTAFPALVTAESTPLFFSLLTSTTAPALRTARILLNQSFVSPERDLALPALPALETLEIIAINQLPLYDLTLPALEHHKLRNLRLAAPVWNQLDPGTVHLPNVTYLALTSDSEQEPVQSLAPPASMSCVARLDLDLYHLTFPVALDLTRFEIANVSCTCDLTVARRPENGSHELRLTYTRANASAWSIVIVDVGEGADVDPARIGMLAAWVE
ncbi:hypothetical protein GGF32_005776 [Allomyces javanicus]|nr:hypothetical protein GGF32_005776 [Allomyces javanicus]